ncbi:glycoside hydrolase [Colletotrichum asianum]
MTPQRCIELAGSLKYAGASNSLESASFVPTEGCGTPCPGDLQQICGGSVATNITRLRARHFRPQVSKRAVPGSVLLTIYERVDSVVVTPGTTTTTIPVGGDSVLPSTAAENITPIPNGGTQLTTIGNTLDPAVPPQPSSFTSVFIVDGVRTTLVGVITLSTAAPSSPTITVSPGPGDDGDVLDPSSSVGLAGSQTVSSVGSPTAGSGAGAGDDGDVLDPSSSVGLAGSQTVSNVGSPTTVSAPGFGEDSDVLEPLTTTLGFATSRTSPSPASGSAGSLGVDMPMTSVVTTITYTTINPANPTALMEAEICSTLYFPDCGCPTQVTPTVPMTTIEASCNRCGSKGENLVTLTVPESPHRTQQSVVEEKYRSGGSHLQPQESKLHPEESQTQPSIVPVEVASASTHLPDAGKPTAAPQWSIASAVTSVVTAIAASSDGSYTSVNQANASGGSGSQDAHGDTVVSPANPSAPIGSIGATDIHSVAAATPTQVVSSSNPESPIGGSSDVPGAGPGVGGTGPGTGSDSGPSSGPNSGMKPLPPSPTESNTGGSVSSKPSTAVVSGCLGMQQWLDGPLFVSTTLFSAIFFQFLN